jgi:hypothetical protein
MTDLQKAVKASQRNQKLYKTSKTAHRVITAYKYEKAVKQLKKAFNA